MTVEYLMVVYRRIIDLLETFSAAKTINRLTFGLKIWPFRDNARLTYHPR